MWAPQSHLVVAIGDRPMVVFCLIIDLDSVSIGLVPIGLGLSLTPSLGRDGTYDSDMPATRMDAKWEALGKRLA